MSVHERTTRITVWLEVAESPQGSSPVRVVPEPRISPVVPGVPANEDAFSPASPSATVAAGVSPAAASWPVAVVSAT